MFQSIYQVLMIKSHNSIKIVMQAVMLEHDALQERQQWTKHKLG